MLPALPMPLIIKAMTTKQITIKTAMSTRPGHHNP